MHNKAKQINAWITKAIAIHTTGALGVLFVPQEFNILIEPYVLLQEGSPKAVFLEIQLRLTNSRYANQRQRVCIGDNGRRQEVSLLSDESKKKKAKSQIRQLR